MVWERLYSDSSWMGIASSLLQFLFQQNQARLGLKRIQCDLKVQQSLHCPCLLHTSMTVCGQVCHFTARPQGILIPAHSDSRNARLTTSSEEIPTPVHQQSRKEKKYSAEPSTDSGIPAVVKHGLLSQRLRFAQPCCHFQAWDRMKAEPWSHSQTML